MLLLMCWLFALSFHSCSWRVCCFSKRNEPASLPYVSAFEPFSLVLVLKCNVVISVVFSIEKLRHLVILVGNTYLLILIGPMRTLNTS